MYNIETINVQYNISFYFHCSICIVYISQLQLYSNYIPFYYHYLKSHRLLVWVIGDLELNFTIY